ncbi:FAD-dependent monooxygenase [Herbaspirillum frisingense]|nr:FAD-dependent monooxygenase [Herbaspirillum frisingense]
MASLPKILVIGAGASGLAFALACAHRGLKVRIIEKRPERSRIQKATGIAQSVWQQLAPYGVTASLIDRALPMKNFVFRDDGKLIANVRVPLVGNEPAAHLLPQAQLEQAMEQALFRMGVKVEYGTSFSGLAQSELHAQLILIRDAVEVENIQFDWIVGADGANSEVRSILRTPFIGRDYPEQWTVSEISTKQWPTEVQAQLFLSTSGTGLFLSHPSPGIVQGIMNAPSVGAALLAHFPDGAIQYERQFVVSLRRVQTPRVKRVWLIGDAAHTQSPVGGQGLNLAIWDGTTLGNALINGDMSVEATLSNRAKRVLFFTDFDYRMLSTKSKFIRKLRNTYWSLACRHPFLSRWFFKLISGAW